MKISLNDSIRFALHRTSKGLWTSSRKPLSDVYISQSYPELYVRVWLLSALSWRRFPAYVSRMNVVGHGEMSIFLFRHSFPHDVRKAVSSYWRKDYCCHPAWKTGMTLVLSLIACSNLSGSVEDFRREQFSCPFFLSRRGQWKSYCLNQYLVSEDSDILTGEVRLRKWLRQWHGIWKS